MDWDDVRPASAKQITLGEPLDVLSLGDLQERNSALEAEILRVKQEIGTKQAHGEAAAAFFKKS